MANSDIDWGDVKNIFYKKYFIQRRDKLTERFNDIINNDFYIDNLPISFIDGLPNLQERNPLPLKTIPLFSKLIKGEYEHKYSKYDTTTVKVNIEFFTNNLPSFEEYKDQDRIDWVVKKHRLLAIEIFDYYKDKEPSLSTLEHRFNSILRMIRIGYGNKLSPLYKLFSVIVFQINDAIKEYEGDNKLNKYEARKYINWLDVLRIQQTIEDTFDAMPDKHTREAYECNNDLLLISLYSLIPPLRNEIKTMEFTNRQKDKPLHMSKDYVYISKNKQHIVLRFNRIKKLHKKVQFDLSIGKLKNSHLAKIIKESYKLYPRDYLFTIKNTYPDVSIQASQRALDERLLYIFFKHGITNKISVNSLRSSYVSYRLSQKDLTYNEKELLAYQMRTSVECLERSYNKVIKRPPVLLDKPDYEIPEDDEILENAEEEKVDPMEDHVHNEASRIFTPVSNQYQKKLLRGRNYYAANKDKIKEAQQKYKAKKTAFEKTRERLLQLLNASEDYAQKMRDSTKEKYKFVFDIAANKWKWSD